MAGKFVSRETAVSVANFYKTNGYRNLRASDINVAIRNNEDGTYSINVTEKDIWDRI